MTTEKITNYSQFNQDLNVLLFYNKKTNGFFVEIGANDGIRLSNTYLLEKEYDWKGICIEPVPQKYNLLCKNRPNSQCYNNPIYDESGKDVEFAISTNGTLFSGIDKHLTVYKSRVDKNKKIIKLKTLTITDVLQKSNAPTFIDYMSIDTEGSEYNVLLGLDFSKYTIGLIDIEHNNIKTMKQNINKILSENGYVFIKENGADDVYIHHSLEKNN